MSGAEAGAKQASATIIAAPTRSPRRRRAWGVFAPVYALYQHAGSAPGDLAALDHLGRWLQPHGGTVIGTLPILAMFVGHGKEPCDPSPYAPVSRRYWNELYLDLSVVPEARRVARGRARPVARPVRRPARARGRAPARTRRGRGAAAAIPATPSGPRAWLAAHPDACDYAEFRAATEGSGRAGVATHVYVQWLMANQLDDLARNLAGRGQSLYIDLPVGAHREGYDVAARPDLFAGDASVGAPPDDFQREGQNWGFPPIDPVRRASTGHAYLAACSTSILQYAGVLRIDHVMGLHRLWMIPPARRPSDGAYVHYPAEEHWATISLEAANRHRGRSSARTSARSRRRRTGRSAATARSGCGSPSSRSPTMSSDADDRAVAVAPG